ncbi:DUF1573 domain-containing protein [Thermodesulfobacteriota bacterium]
MKKCLSLSILGILLFVYSAHASNLKLSESSINFGSVKEGPPVTKTITLTNEGTELLTISNTATSCACTTVGLSKSSLNPGESTELLITYDTYKYPGKFDKTVTIFTGPEGKEENVIHISGNVDPIPMGVIEMEPRKTVVGELMANEGNHVQIKIKNKGDAPLRVSRIYSTKFKKEYYNAKNSGEIEIGTGGIYKVDLKVTPPKPGRFLDVILIYSDARNDIGKGYKGLISGTAK